MAIQDPGGLFVMLLSNVRHAAERASESFRKMSDYVDNPEIKEVLQARAFLSDEFVSSLDECFRILGTAPIETSGRLADALLEDVRSQWDEMESPEAKALFILAKAHQLNEFRMGQYSVLIEMADAMGHQGIGLLIASCLADKIAFVERTRHLIRKILREKVEMRLAA